MKITLHGGEPQGCTDIECEDVGKKGGIMNNVRKLFTSGPSTNKSELTISINPLTKMLDW
jgi:hypothetical protein